MEFRTPGGITDWIYLVIHIMQRHILDVCKLMKADEKLEASETKEGSEGSWIPETCNNITCPKGISAPAAPTSVIYVLVLVCVDGHKLLQHQPTPNLPLVTVFCISEQVRVL